MTHDLITRAVQFATDAHEGQIHRDGKPAIEHSLAVAENFRSEPEVYAIAVLHDVLEDCDWLDSAHIKNLFGGRIADGVTALSRVKGESWSSYIRRVKADPIAVRIKMADIEHNISRADEKFLQKMKMYTDTLIELSLLQFPHTPCTSDEK